jgi:hypothetical protein
MKKMIRNIVIYVIVFFLIILLFFLCYNYEKKEYSENEKLALYIQPVIQAIYDFKRDSCYYPDSLNKIMPKYVNNIDLSNWMYYRINDKFKIGIQIFLFPVFLDYTEDGTCWKWEKNVEGHRKKISFKKFRINPIRKCEK